MSNQREFNIGDEVVWNHPILTKGVDIKGEAVFWNHDDPVYPLYVTFDGGHLVNKSFTEDGRLFEDEEPTLRLATPTWTVILLYPDYLTGDFGADIFVDSAEAADPYEATKLVQVMASLAQEADEDGDSPDPDDFRCIGVIKGEHSFVLDATSF